MVTKETSPDPEVAIRTDRTHTPRFADLSSVPTPLRELQSQDGGALLTPQHPSEFTALAIRLRKIRLDESPEDAPSSDGKTSPVPGKPMRLDFGDNAIDIVHDKENVDNGASGPGSARASRTVKSLEREFGQDVASFSAREPEQSDSQGISEPAKSDTPGVQGSQDAPATAKSEAPVAVSVPLSKEASVHLSGTARTALMMGEENSQGKTSGTVNACARGDQISSDDENAVCTSSEGPDTAIVNRLSGPSPEKMQDPTVEVDHSCEASQQVGDADVDSLTREGKSGHAVPSNAEGSATQLTCGEGSARSVSTPVEGHVNRLLEGKDRWSWPKRCEAMNLIAEALNTVPSEDTLLTVRTVLPTLAVAVNDNLDELRPSVMTAALNLVNSIVVSKVDEGSQFAEEVFPSVMDLACGRSLTAQEAARSLAVVLSLRPELSAILEDADNPDRLCELLGIDANSNSIDVDTKARAGSALKLVQASIFKDASDAVTTPRPVSCTNIEKDADSSASSGAVNSATLAGTAPSDVNVGKALSPPSATVAAPTSKGAASRSPSTTAQTPRAGRMSLRLDRFHAGGLKSTPRHSMRGLSESRMSTPLMRNMKLGESIRKISPGSAKKRRMYTEEEVEEARRTAMRVVMEEASQAQAKEREKCLKEKEDVEKSLRKEQSLVAELQGVLGEYEMTMQTMVSQGNSHASAYTTSLENETKKLKAELLEVTEAYETVKERYDSAKQTMKVYENKEARNIEQIKELKKNMAELQKWSNDLKANTEKKLSKAFESVTTYRASYMDKEAHLSKANSDLIRHRAELDEEVSKHAETAGSLSRLEAKLHEEQDHRSSVEASLASSREALARVTSQKDRLQKDLGVANEELKQVKTELARMRDADSRATEAAKQLESFSVESQSLKARAYDDMTRIRALERELEAKEKEYEEISTVCEEALLELEKVKVKGH